MRIKHFALMAILFTIVVSGCKKIEEALDVTFDTSFSTDLDAIVTPGTKTGIDGTFQVSETIDPAADDNVEAYMDKIKSWDVTEIKAEVISTSKDANLSSLNLSVSNQNHNAQWAFQNIAISPGTVVTLDNGNGQWDSVNNILGELQVFTIMASGTTDEDDLQFTIRVTIKSKVTANPL